MKINDLKSREKKRELFSHQIGKSQESRSREKVGGMRRRGG
jgi:hypothetical protein